MGEVFVLEKAFKAQTGKIWKIEFEWLEDWDTDEHHYFEFRAVPEDGGETFVYRAQVSRALVDAVGVDITTHPKKLMRVTAGKGMADLKKRLNAGHASMYGSDAYFKTYTTRDADDFRRYLPTS